MWAMWWAWSTWSRGTSCWPFFREGRSTSSPWKTTTSWSGQFRSGKAFNNIKSLSIGQLKASNLLLRSILVLTSTEFHWARNFLNMLRVRWHRIWILVAFCIYVNSHTDHCECWKLSEIISIGGTPSMMLKSFVTLQWKVPGMWWIS